MSTIFKTRAAGIAGILGSAAYLYGDIALIGRDYTPERHPILKRNEQPATLVPLLGASKQDLRIGGRLAFAAPAYLAGIWHLHQGLQSTTEKTTRWQANTATGLLALAWTLPAYMHGSFEALGRTYHLADQALQRKYPPRDVDEVLSVFDDLRTSVAIVYPAFMAATATASLLMFSEIIRGKSRYPRWAAPLVNPAATISVSHLVELLITRNRPSDAPLRGASFSVGHLITWTTSTILLWRKELYEQTGAVRDTFCGSVPSS